MPPTSWRRRVNSSHAHLRDSTGHEGSARSGGNDYWLAHAETREPVAQTAVPPEESSEPPAGSLEPGADTAEQAAGAGEPAFRSRERKSGIRAPAAGAS